LESLWLNVQRIQVLFPDGDELLGEEDLAINDESIEDYLSVSDEDMDNMDSIVASNSFISVTAPDDNDRATLVYS